MTEDLDCSLPSFGRPLREYKGFTAEALAQRDARIRAEAAEEIAQAIDDHRDGYGACHPEDAFGDGLTTAAIIAREHAADRHMPKGWKPQ